MAKCVGIERRVGSKRVGKADVARHFIVARWVANTSPRLESDIPVMGIMKGVRLSYLCISCLLLYDGGMGRREKDPADTHET
jgi:hypothetical protein